VDIYDADGIESSAPTVVFPGDTESFYVWFEIPQSETPTHIRFLYGYSQVWAWIPTPTS